MFYSFTWYMAYLGTILTLRRKLLVFMKTMATGHREVMVRTPMKGLIQMAVPVISSWERICVFIYSHGEIRREA